MVRDGAGEEVLGVTDLDALPLEEERGSARESSALLNQVGHEDNGQLFLEILQHILDAHRGHWIDGDGELVEQQQLWFLREGARDGESLLLSAAEQAAQRVQAILDLVPQRRAALWDEVKDRLDALGSLLSGGQQQRLTIARALSQEPQLLLLDEFSIAVDPVTTMRIEDVLKDLKEELTIILVTNLVQQCRRLASRTAFFLQGECVEVGNTEDFFTGTVSDQRTRDYVEGRFG